MADCFGYYSKMARSSYSEKADKLFDDYMKAEYGDLPNELWKTIRKSPKYKELQREWLEAADLSDEYELIQLQNGLNKLTSVFPHLWD